MDINIFTIPGAAAAALVLAQFAKAAGVRGVAVRLVALFGGLVVFCVAVLLTSPFDPLLLAGAIIGGAQAGLSAIAAYDAGKSGIDYQVTDG